MPPKQRISKQNIIDAGFKILSKNGMESINARAICSKLNCSTQPIFSQFANMDELKLELFQKAREVYNEYVKNALSGSDSPYKASALAYINFAKHEPHLFSLLFMNETNVKDNKFRLEREKESHFNLWVYTHGIATLIATKSMQFSDEQIDKMIADAYDTIVLK